jgi:hypothetical protein
VGLLGLVGLSQAFGAENKPNKGSWSGTSQINGSAPRVGGYRMSMQVVGGKTRKVTGLVTDARRCDGALTRFEADKRATVKNGKFTLKDTTNYTDGFVTLTFSGKFTSKTRASGTIAVNSKYQGTPCHYTMKLLRLGAGGGRPPHGRPPHH